MDLKAYYAKVRDVLARLPQGDVLVVSEETADGGRGGEITEAPREVAARLIVEGKAREASAEELELWRRERAAEAKQRQEELASRQIRVHMLTDTELKALSSSGQKSKG
jgi:ribosomal protein L9